MNRNLSALVRMAMLVALFFISLLSFAQQSKTVSGKVTDAAGSPLAGVTIMVEGTYTGSMTDMDGAYSLNVQDPSKASLVFSCLGYKTETRPVGASSVVNIALAEDTQLLDEIVVVGYGTQKKVNITGSVTAVDFEKQMDGRVILTPATSLSGLVPGMNVSQTSAQPGQEKTTLRIRGTGTFSSAGSDPLVLVDGVEWNMSDVNPEDIASISVLKDAASTAIYGTRAANGVILITTKSGKKGNAKISYSYSGIVQMPYNNLEFVTDYVSYMNYVNEASHNVGGTDIFKPNTIEQWTTAAKNPNSLTEAGVPNYMAYPNTDWFEEVFSTGYSQQHNLSVSGANDKVKYLVSMSYVDNQGVINRYDINSSTQKANFRANIEADVTKWFKLGTKILGQYQQYGMANISDGFSYLNMTTPGVYPGEPGKWGKPASDDESTQAANILQRLSGRGGYDHRWKLSGSLFGVITFFEGFTAEATVNYSPSFRDYQRYSLQTGTWNYIANELVSISNMAEATVTRQADFDHKMSSDILLRYNGTFGDHAVGALAGYSAIYYKDFGKFGVGKTNASDWSLHDLGTFSELTSASSDAALAWGLRSYFARANYAYKDRYLFEANVRVDGSSRFGPGKKYGVFPSVSAGWKLSEEPWMAETKTWLTSLKLRASWGQTGNNSIGNYAWQSLYQTTNVVINGKPTTGLYAAALSNSNLGWETTTTTDIGVDFSFFDNQLTGEVDVYNRMTSDILNTPPIYLTMGHVGGVPSNQGKMVNGGVEIALNWNSKVGKEFFYHVGANFSWNRNKVVKYKGELKKYWDTDADGKPVYRTNLSDVSTSWGGGLLCEGHIVGEQYRYRLYKGTGWGLYGGEVDPTAGPVDGMIRTDSDLEWVKAMIDAGYMFAGNKKVAPNQLWYGDFIYSDLNGDGDYGNSDDREFTGYSAQPIYNLGINLGFSWKGIDLNMVWAGAMGNRLIWKTGTYNNTSIKHGRGLMKHVVADHYFYDPANPDDSRTNIYGKYPRLTYDYDASNLLESEFYEYKGDYLKLRNLQVGYTLPEHITKKFFVSKLRAYVSMDNLLTITAYPGLDPEIGTEIGYPLMRQISFGAQITF